MRRGVKLVGVAVKAIRVETAARLVAGWGESIAR
jgi:hypothetical protein